MSWTRNVTQIRPVDLYYLEITTRPYQPRENRRQEMKRVVNTTNTFHVIDNYNRGLVYRFRVIAINAAGGSGYSPIHELNPVIPTTEPIRGLAPWGVFLIVFFILLLCCACCWWIICLILVCCFYRRERRKVYKAEERGEKLEHSSLYRSTVHLQSAWVLLSLSFCPAEMKYGHDLEQ